MSKIRNLCIVGTFGISALAAPAVQAGNTRTSAAPVVQSYPCVQSNSVNVGPNFAADAPPPAWVENELKSTLHQNGLTCYTITGGTTAQRITIQSQLLAKQGQRITPYSWPNSCTATDYFASYNVVPVFGETVNDTIHYSVGATCLHKFYYNREIDSPANSSLKWRYTQDCGATHTTLCTSQEGLNSQPLDTYQYAYFGTQQTNNVDQSWNGLDTYCYPSCNINTTAGFTTN